MDKPRFVYVTFINSSPRKVWDALQDPEMTREYWVRHRNASDWQVGSAWEHQDYEDPTVVDIAGKVIEIDPPRRLILSWAAPAELDRPEKTSRVTFDIATIKGVVRLTVTHEDLEPDSDMLRGITEGWPVILSSLKTMLETGAAMGITRERWTGPLG